METFSALLVLCAGKSPVPNEFPSQRPVTQSFGVFFDLCLIHRWPVDSPHKGPVTREMILFDDVIKGKIRTR